MSETLPVIDMPVNIDMDVNKGKMLLEILQNAAKFNHGFSFGTGGPGGVPASPATPGVPTGTFNPGAIPGAGSPGNGRGIASRAGNAMLNTVIAPFILLGKTTDLTTKSVKIFGSALKKTTGVLQGSFTSVLKWSLGLTAVAGGGMFGYSRMAKAVSNDFNASRGLRVSTAFNKAFNTVWGNKLDGAGELLANISEAQSNPQAKANKHISALGINPNGDVQSTTISVLQSAWEFAQQHKNDPTGKGLFDVWYGGIPFVGGAYNQLQQMSEKEFNNNLDMTFRQTRNYESSEQTQLSYQDLLIQLEGNMNSLGSTFVEMLKDLNPQILKFSDVITKNLNEFMTGNGKDLFTKVGEGLKWLTGYIASDKFKKDLEDFGLGVKEVGGAIWKVVKWINENFSLKGVGEGKDELSSYDASDFDKAVVEYGNKFLGGKLPGANPITNKYTGIFEKERYFKNYKMPHDVERNIKFFVEQVNDAAGLPKGMMGAIADIESSWNPFAVNESSGARGLWQLIKSTAEGYNLAWEDAFDPNKSTPVAARYLADNMYRYKGDITKTLAQYNGGNKAVQGNKLNVKLETINYLLKALELIPDMSKQHAGLGDKLIVGRNKVGNSGGRVEIDLSVKNAPGSDINTQVTGTRALGASFSRVGIIAGGG